MTEQETSDETLVKNLSVIYFKLGSVSWLIVAFDFFLASMRRTTIESCSTEKAHLQPNSNPEHQYIVTVLLC
jgi:hypothetical protein